MNDRLVEKANRNVWESIRSFNAQREPTLVAQKYAKMRQNAFAFYRGTCHLFYQDLPRESSLNLAPSVWICGDLHLENFGAYKGDDVRSEQIRRQIYFGINDFDEGVLAPCTWDIARLLTSILLAVENLSFDRADGDRLIQVCLDSYTDTLSAGKIESIVEANARGIVGDLLKALSHRKRSELLTERTKLINVGVASPVENRRQLRFDDCKILPLDRQQRIKITNAIDDWARNRADKDFFEVLDIGFRVAGTGSLGLDRYLILVEGKGSPDRNYLLDLKQQQPSALMPYLTQPQPQWANQALRVMQIQKLVQPAPPALLAAIEFDGGSYLLRELQPTQDKLELKSDRISLPQLEKLIETIGRIVAFAHLHSSGKMGAAIDREAILYSRGYANEFGQNLDWHSEILNYASNYARQVRVDFRDFCKATKDL
ncbi:DUF2252 domain-containing protein [Chamaesiphon sp. VAR_69_metabat_338]|uniref:DUF2252 domain-containing protein n=1 Tax=Chamaesiphon sp. VAR_69_metabat_338 TaxID=2964704 RepID=UPI00286DFE6E|nr:DUF2252 domain-containing protein [Chamaesiphon sp. VAR_69_metabat_338]